MDEPFVLCDSPPLFILTKHNRIGAPSFSGLDQDITPLFPVESRSEVDGVAFSRMQVPISPGFAITDFKSQGISVDKGIVDIRINPANSPPREPGVNHKNYTSLNVQLGRIRSLDGLWLREPIQLADVQSKPDPALHVEVERLRVLEEQTIRLWTSA
jgi:hypothetical protein